MNRFIVFMMLIFLSCSSGVQKAIYSPASEPAVNLTDLEKFFKMTEDDAFKAGNVVEKNKMIQNLSHLKNMDTGGKRYYLLERDNITEMIKAVTAGIYTDFILINRSGDIIYTGKDDNVFGSNINNGFEETPLKACFNRREGIHFEDVDMMTPSSNVLGLYVSVPVYTDDAYQGALILQIDITGIKKLFDDTTDIISREGLIRIASDKNRILSRYIGFSEIDIESLDRNKKWTSGGSGKRTDYSVFSYKNISWIIARKSI